LHAHTRLRLPTELWAFAQAIRSTTCANPHSRCDDNPCSNPLGLLYYGTRRTP
jgi:hypothetical protein